MLPGAMWSAAGMPASVAATSGTLKPPGVCCGMKKSDFPGRHVALRIDARRACRSASAGPSGPSRARRRATTARAPACRPPWRAARRRRRRPRGRCGRSSRSLRGRCSARSRRGMREHLRELLAQIVRRSATPTRSQLAVLEFRDRAGRADRAVGVDGEVVGGLECLGALLASASAVSPTLLGHPRPWRPWSRARAPKASPARAGSPISTMSALSASAAADRGPFVSATTPRKLPSRTTLTMPGMPLIDAVVDAFELGADRGRAHHAAVQHAGHAEVLHVGEASRSPCPGCRRAARDLPTIL